MSADPAKATALIKAAVDAGSTEAGNQLALYYYSGTGVTKDSQLAHQLLKQATERGSSIAAYNLGIDSLRGQPVPANNRQAHAWLQQAADQGLLEARRLLAYLSLEQHPGFEVNSQDSRAIRNQLQHIAESGDGWSSYALGVLWLRGQGGPANTRLGYAWLNVAVALGYQPASSIRDAVALQLTHPQLESAQSLSQALFDQATEKKPPPKAALETDSTTSQ